MYTDGAAFVTLYLLGMAALLGLISLGFAVQSARAAWRSGGAGHTRRFLRAVAGFCAAVMIALGTLTFAD